MEQISRSMNAELREGATDAVIKKENGPDRINSAATSILARQTLNRGVNGYGIDPAPESYAREIIAGVVRGT